MKKVVIISFMLFLCLWCNTVAVYADDGTVDTGAGITFYGEMPTVEEPAETPKAGGGKASLPQTGQESSTILSAAGAILLIIACGQILIRSEKSSLKVCK